MSLALERFLELAHRFGRPSHQALWISFGLQQFLQIGTQPLILGCDLLPSPTPPADATSWLIELSCLQFLQTLVDRLARDSRLAGHLADPSWTPSLGLSRYVQPPLSLIEHSVHHLILILLRVIYHALILSHLPPSLCILFP